MTLYVLQRLASIVVVLVLISIIIFVAIHVLPGSAATLILGEYATPAALSTLEQEMGLDRPLLVQYGAWVRDVLTGRWGDSRTRRRSPPPRSSSSAASPSRWARRRRSRAAACSTSPS
jgi:peptide/nickel transport system permease protein